MPIKAIFFDLDATLYSGKDFNKLCFWKIIFRYPFLFLSYCKVRKEFHEIPYVEDIYNEECIRLAKKARISYSLAKSFIDNFIHGELDYQLSRMDAYPFVNSILESLHRSYIVGILSDFPIGEKLHYLHIKEEYLDYQLCSMDYNALKPSSLVFEQLQKKTQLQPKEILYVGNSFSYDIQGAKRLGYKTAYFTHKKNIKNIMQEDCDFVFHDFSNLLNFIINFP